LYTRCGPDCRTKVKNCWRFDFFGSQHGISLDLFVVFTNITDLRHRMTRAKTALSCSFTTVYTSQKAETAKDL
jgi:hypothetical protein